MRRRSALPVVPALGAAALVLAAVSPAAAAPGPFRPVATFVVDGDVAEIITATPDGKTVLYTDSSLGRIGLVDITRPGRPEQTGTVDVGGSPTSVALTKDGRLALVAVDTTEDLTKPSGTLVVVDVERARVVRALPLGGQPDSIDVSPDGGYAAIAIENQRDEEATVGGAEGGLPQRPAGFLSVVEIGGPVGAWTARRVALTGLRGVMYPTDPEPEFVDINRANVAAVTLQENNAVALVDLERGKVVRSYSAGSVQRRDADTVDDGVTAFDDSLRAPREPDAVRWTPDGNLVTADEGDLTEEPSGGRGWTVFTRTGAVVFASGSSAERALARNGFYDDERSDDKGAEIEGAEVATYAGDELAFIGSERGDAVLVYDLDDEARPRLLQVLATGDAPEGLLAIPQRGLFLASNEDDGSLSIFSMR